MEKVVTSIVLFPSGDKISHQDYHKELRQLGDLLSKSSPSNLIGSQGNDPLDVLDFSKHSLGVLHIFNARLKSDRSDMRNLWPRVALFLETFDARQMRGSMDMFRNVIEEFTGWAGEAGATIRTVKPLKAAIIALAYPHSPTYFSFLHILFIRMCLDAKCFRDAISILDHDIEAFPHASEKEITYKDQLTYHYYGATIYIAAKKWNRAAAFLTFVITCPGNATSNIQVEAAKRLVFVNLMMDGKNHDLPRVTPPHTTRAFKGLLKPYESFANAYASRNPEALRKESLLVAEAFRHDGNWGLAQICLEKYRTMGIAGLTHTYSTLSVEHIMGRDMNVDPLSEGLIDTSQAETYILGMIERDEIKASLSHINAGAGIATCMVTFHDTPPSEFLTLHKLEEQIARTVRLTNQSRALDRKIGNSKEWAAWLNRKATRSGGGGGGGFSGGDPGGPGLYSNDGESDMSAFAGLGSSGLSDMGRRREEEYYNPEYTADEMDHN